MTIPLPQGIRLETGPGGLERLTIDTDLAQAQVYLHGGHVTLWQPRGLAPVLWMSAKSQFEAGKPIRGGVPVCFPWFGRGPDNSQSPAHGLARLVTWQLASATLAPDGAALLRLLFPVTDQTRAAWPHDFTAQLDLALGRTCAVALTVRNTGPGPLTYEEALHHYFTVGDVRRVEVRGLEGAPYLDTVGTPTQRTQDRRPITIAAETDRLYLNHRDDCTIHDPVLRRNITIRKTNSDSTVIWNPWIAKAKAMPDFGDDEWPGMLCVETANVRENCITLAPGAAHTMTATVAVAAL
jgi:glucose-6-phosphate 1-epimerase